MTSRPKLVGRPTIPPCLVVIDLLLDGVTEVVVRVDVVMTSKVAMAVAVVAAMTTRGVLPLVDTLTPLIPAFICLLPSIMLSLRNRKPSAISAS